MMQSRVKDTFGKELARRPVKILNFGILYGMGSPLLAAQLGVSVEEAKDMMRAVKQAAPDIAALDAALKERGAKGEPIRTWGGRLYYCEQPKYVEKYKRMMTFEYKLLNYLIQGSAADCTKEAIIRYHDLKKEGRMLVTVHDEINLSAPAKAAAAESKRLKEAMESVEFDVPMLTSAKFGPSWGELAKEARVAA
jgi:DNA polymerase-1